MKIISIKAYGLKGETPKGGWANEIKGNDGAIGGGTWWDKLSEMYAFVYADGNGQLLGVTFVGKNGGSWTWDGF